ncbi:MAG: Ig-like domain-containing protein [Gemmatimonadetes bacterium]|nr:Ig-like domain-containing protein [Gemmatimonadota bacterium]
MQDPPGGPPDFTPPILLNTRPDSGAVVPDYRSRAVFQFDEVIDERSGGGLIQLFVLSPRPEKLEVSWKRTRIEVRPDGGWQPGVIYHLTLLPGITDLSNNRREERTQVVFSTGGEIPNTRLGGTILNWNDGRAAPRGLVEAVLLPDSLVYLATADSVGDFTLSALPPGEYQVFATVDENNNRRRDRREPYDSMAVTLDSSFSGVFWAFIHDTVGPQLRSATRLDSVTVQLDFNQKLYPGEPDSAAVTVQQLPDSTPVSVAAVWLPEVYDSVRAVEAAAAAAAARAAADTAVGDTVAPAAPDTVEPDRPVPLPVEEVEASPDTNRITLLLAQRPPLEDRWVIRLAAPLAPGSRYLIETRTANVNGAIGESRTLLIVPADTTAGEQ